MLTNLLDLDHDNNLSVRDVHEEEKSSRSTIKLSFNIVSQVLYLFSLVNY